MLRALFALLGVVAVALCAQARAADPIKEKLDKAKAAYAADLEKFEKEIGEYFDKREEAARKAGDKKAVDLVKTERKTFEEKGELPASAPKAAKQRLATARTTMERAYAAAVKEYTMAKKDDDAATTEKELTAFKQGLDPTDTRHKWVHDKGSFARLANGEWEEKLSDGKVYRWKETARTKDYVELQSTIGNTAYTVRLTDKTAEYQSGKGADFKTGYTGKWTD